MKWVIGIGIVVAVIGFPLFMAWGLTWEWTSFAKGPDSAWIGFWGSYLGGLVSGVITFAGVYFGFKLQDNKNKLAEDERKRKEIFRNYVEVYTIYMWCEDIVKYIEGSYVWDIKRVREAEDRARECNKAMVDVDIYWHKELKDLFSESFEVTATIECYGVDKFNELDSEGKFKEKVRAIQRKIIPYIKIDS